MSLPARDLESVQALKGRARFTDHLGAPAPENYTMMHVESIEAIEPLSAAILELGRCYSSGAITRDRLFSRLRELSVAESTTRRRRPRTLPQLVPPVTFYSLDEAAA
jgi:hypothetical protein